MDKKREILVIGDIILDKYIHGIVERISPEAPVPVILFENESCLLGGASNVARNIASFGVNVTLIGRIGNDKNGKLIEKKCKENNINSNQLFIVDNLTTITKTRYVNKGQQLFRLDREKLLPINESQEDEVIEFLKSCLNRIDIVILSDYNKGFLTLSLTKKIIQVCNELGMKVLIDPKKKDFNDYKGAFLLTPNEKEAENSTGVKIFDEVSLLQCFEKLVQQTGNPIQLITRSEKGMSLYNHGQITNFKAQAKDVFDITGAGDTVIAAIAYKLSHGCDILESVRFSNYAGSVVVGKFGSSVTNEKEVISYINQNIDLKNNIFDSSDSQIEDLIIRCEEKSIVFTNGCFDLLHLGHLTYLKEASKLGDILIVGLNSDSSVRMIKGEKRPILNEMNRSSIIAALEFVDFVVIFDEDTPTKILSKIKPNTLVKGGDYSIDQVVGKQFADQVIIIPFIKGHSSTSIINKILTNHE
jgi:D-beta-D-heptose 7-phosphate kinase/D-beta-D-heptose 1-phosphate adenosyltransferase